MSGTWLWGGNDGHACKPPSEGYRHYRSHSLWMCSCGETYYWCKGPMRCSRTSCYPSGGWHYIRRYQIVTRFRAWLHKPPAGHEPESPEPHEYPFGYPGYRWIERNVR